MSARKLFARAREALGAAALALALLVLRALDSRRTDALRADLEHLARVAFFGPPPPRPRQLGPWLVVPPWNAPRAAHELVEANRRREGLS